MAILERERLLRIEFERLEPHTDDTTPSYYQQNTSLAVQKGQDNAAVACFNRNKSHVIAVFGFGRLRRHEIESREKKKKAENKDDGLIYIKG